MPVPPPGKRVQGFQRASPPTSRPRAWIHPLSVVCVSAAAARGRARAPALLTRIADAREVHRRMRSPTVATNVWLSAGRRRRRAQLSAAGVARPPLILRPDADGPAQWAVVAVLGRDGLSTKLPTEERCSGGTAFGVSRIKEGLRPPAWLNPLFPTSSMISVHVWFGGVQFLFRIVCICGLH